MSTQWVNVLLRDPSELLAGAIEITIEIPGAA